MKKFAAFILASVLLSSCDSSSKLKEPGSYAVITTSMGSITVRLLTDGAPKTVENFIGLATGKKEWKNQDTGTASMKPFYDGLIFHRVIKDFMIQGGCPKGDGTGGPGYEFEDETYRPTDRELTGPVQDDKVASLVFNQLIVPYVIASGQDNLNPVIKTIIQDVMMTQSGKSIYGRTVEDYVKMTGGTGKVMDIELIHPVSYGALCMANSGPNTNGSQFFIVTKKEGCSWLDGQHTVFGEVVLGMDVVHAIEAVAVDENDKPVKPVSIKGVKIIQKK
jgi:cyclophilin family peptidyl-prolyl cis-trans isomerase